MKKTLRKKRTQAKTIAILYHRINKKEQNSYYSEENAISDIDTTKTVRFLRSLFRRRNIHVQTITVSRDDLTQLKDIRANYIYNLVDSKAMEIKISRILDRLKIPHSGSPLSAIRISNNKILTKKLFDRYGLPTPRYTIISQKTRLSKYLLPSKFPIIVKPAFEHCSIGISDHSIATTYAQFKAIVKRQRRLYKQTLLAEEFIVGREFHVTVLEKSDATVALPIAEIGFKRGIRNKWNIYGFDEKWSEDLPIYTSAHFVAPPKKLDSLVDASIKQDVIRAFYLFGLRDYARFDIRYNPKKKQWYFLEANANAGITPGDSTDAMNASIDAAGMTLASFIMTIIENGLPLKGK
jgi:D-alanine-D-alanine ligase